MGRNRTVPPAKFLIHWFSSGEPMTERSPHARRLVPAYVLPLAALALACFVALTAPAGGADSAPARFEFSQPHMGTLFRLVLYARTETEAREAAGAAFARIAALDAKLSDYRRDSELARLCGAAGSGPVRVSEDLFRVLALAKEWGERTGGAFDVTAGPVVRLWRRARRQGELPDAAGLARARHVLGIGKLRLDAATRSATLETPGMLLDLGGIAKGFAADEALAVLAARGVSSALVAAGGDVAASDAPPGRDAWEVAVSPRGPRAEPTQVLRLRNAAVSTSGDAEQFVEIGGRRYSHIIDPRSGLAVTGRFSVSVVAPRGALSDLLATAASVLGPERGMELVGAVPGTAAFFTEARAGGDHTYPSSSWGDLVGARASLR